MFSPNTLAETRELVKQTIHIQSENWNEKYLGLPVHVGKSKKKAFAYVKGSMAGKVYGWQERLIAKVGKETLVKAVAQAIPTFAMSCFYLTKSFCQELSSLMGKYWWSQQEKENTLHWISWEKLTRSKAQGGLAQFLPRIKLKEGYALPADLAFDPKPGVPLRSNPEGPIFFPNTHVLDAVAKDGISYSWRSLLHGLDLFKEGYIWRIGEGTQVRFWSDLWLPRPWSQKVLTPRGASLLEFVSDLISPITGSWDEQLVRDTFWPVDAASILQIPLREGVDDFIAWQFEAKGNHTIKSAYKLHVQLEKNERDGNAGSSTGLPGNLDNCHDDSWKRLWKLPCPRNIQMFA
uniref:Reverse transcriptase zinc-binding domain-containing protein n=1 Tax=Aegilops tauschii subsp. strangulata TaxID=200361 RepID=A0A453D5L5_AEGTS